MNNNYILIIGIFIIGTGCLIGIFKQMKDGFGPYNLKVYGITLVIIFTSVLVLSEVELNKLTICSNILAAIAGYLFGLKKE